jgi:hypothetical protein
MIKRINISDEEVSEIDGMESDVVVTAGRCSEVENDDEAAARDDDEAAARDDDGAGSGCDAHASEESTAIVAGSPGNCHSFGLMHPHRSAPVHLVGSPVAREEDSGYDCDDVVVTDAAESLAVSVRVRERERVQ